jgi:ParB/RepB/Spo0J family partition protein
MAAKRAGLESVPVVIRDVSDREALEMILVENVQREDMSAVDKAKVIQTLREKFSDVYPTWETVADKLGLDFETIKSWVRTLDLPVEIQEKIAAADPVTLRLPRGTIDYQTALHVVERIKDKPRQIEVVERLAEKRIPQRMAKQIIKQVSLKPESSVDKIMQAVVEAPPQLPFMSEHASPVLKGIKTQTSRKGLDPRIRPGMKVEAYTRFAELRVTGVSRKKLRDFTEEDAKREGGYDLAEFKKVWKRLHGEWNPDESVSVVNFKLEKSSFQN